MPCVVRRRRSHFWFCPWLLVWSSKSFFFSGHQFPLLWRDGNYPNLPLLVGLLWCSLSWAGVLSYKCVASCLPTRHLGVQVLAYSSVFLVKTGLGPAIPVADVLLASWSHRARTFHQLEDLTTGMPVNRQMAGIPTSDCTSPEWGWWSRRSLLQSAKGPRQHSRCCRAISEAESSAWRSV